MGKQSKGVSEVKQNKYIVKCKNQGPCMLRYKMEQTVQTNQAVFTRKIPGHE